MAAGLRSKSTTTGTSPTMRPNTMKLMLEDRVFLLFGYVGTPTVTRALPLLKKFQDERVYMFFPFTGAQPKGNPLTAISPSTSGRPTVRRRPVWSTTSFESAGGASACFTRPMPTAVADGRGVRAALEAHGEQIAGEATYSRGQNFTGSMRRQVEILTAASPDAVICIGSYAACAGFARDAVDLGLRVPIANLSFVGSENLLQLLTESHDDAEPYTRLLVNSQVVPSYENTAIPAVLEYRELMSRYDPAVPEELVQEPYNPFPQSFVSLEGFLNAKLMTEILRRLEGEPARAGLEEAVFSVRNFDLGIGENVSFGPNRRQGLQRVYYTVVQDGRFVTLEDWQGWLS